MEVEISQSEQWLRFGAWLEDNWRRVAGIASTIIVVGVAVAFFMWQGGQKQRDASEALSLVLSRPNEVTGAALLNVAQEHEGTEAARRAVLLAAGAFYREGNFTEARDLFRRLLEQAPGGPLTPQARFGVAACLEALGETDAAIADYRAIADNPANGVVVPQARFALGNLYEQRGETELAREQYDALTDLQGATLAAAARLRLSQLPAATVSRQVEVPAAAVAPAAGATN